MKNYTWAFFGTSDFSVVVLDELKQVGYLPSLIITTEDKPKGRRLIITPPEVKVWAEKNNIHYLQPKKLDSEFTLTLSAFKFELFIVVSYGKIIPQSILDIPKRGTLNVHPSLLPKLRGASPIQSAILFENKTGVTIMRLDAEMDHGPIVVQKTIITWGDTDVPYAKNLEDELSHAGGKMLVEILPDWLSGKIDEVRQDHGLATFCKKIEKEDGKLDLADDPETNLRKIKAYHIWPTTYYFHKHRETQIRVIIKTAHIEDGVLIFDRVVPEGKKEMNYSDFLKGLK